MEQPTESGSFEFRGIAKHYPGTMAVNFGPEERLVCEFGHIHALAVRTVQVSRHSPALPRG